MLTNEYFSMLKQAEHRDFNDEINLIYYNHETRLYNLKHQQTLILDNLEKYDLILSELGYGYFQFWDNYFIIGFNDLNFPPTKIDLKKWINILTYSKDLVYYESSTGFDLCFHKVLIKIYYLEQKVKLKIFI